jgi:hypothetical protein
VVNAFAWDGNGIASYFLAPVTERTVIVGKNLAVGLFCGVLAVECLTAWSVIRGVPGPSTLLSGLMVFCATVLTLVITGNFTSVTFPVRRLISSANNSPSQTSVLIMLAVVVGNAVVSGMLILLADLVVGIWLRPIVLAIYTGALVAAYLAFLGPVSVLLRSRRENLCAALEGGEQG